MKLEKLLQAVTREQKRNTNVSCQLQLKGRGILLFCHIRINIENRHMNVILLEKIQNLGNLGDLVSVKPGYARNFLVPYRKAVWATEEARVKVEERRIELAKLEEERLDVAQAKADVIPGELVVIRKAGEGGKLYGSVTASDLAEMLNDRGIAVGRGEISLPHGPLKELGEISVDILLHPEVRSTMLVKVIEET